MTSGSGNWAAPGFVEPDRPGAAEAGAGEGDEDEDGALDVDRGSDGDGDGDADRPAAPAPASFPVEPASNQPPVAPTAASSTTAPATPASTQTRGRLGGSAEPSLHPSVMASRPFRLRRPNRSVLPAGKGERPAESAI